MNQCSVYADVLIDNLDAAKKHVGLRFVCLSDKNTRFPELPDFPPKACKGGIMTVHHFVRIPSTTIFFFSKHT
jgi:hypothetical protein